MGTRYACLTAKVLFLWLSLSGIRTREQQPPTLDEELSDAVADLLYSVKIRNEGRDYDAEDPEEEEKDNVVLDSPAFIRERRVRWMRCSFHNLCYCRNRVSHNEFCCDCTQGQCFPADATVHTESDGDIRMDELKVGQRVLTVSEDGQPVYTEVVTFLDRRPRGEGEYMVIETKGGSKIHLSANHLIFSSPDNSSLPLPSRYARELNTGDYLMSFGSSFTGPAALTPIVNISRHVLTGAYVPLTEHGTIVVGGIMASCYASFDHKVAHVALSPMRWFPHLLGLQHDSPPGIPLYVVIAKTVGRSLLPRSLHEGGVYWSEMEMVRHLW